MRIQRGKVKFGYRDSYDFSTLEQIIHDWLKNFRETLIKRNSEGGCLGVPPQFIPAKYDVNSHYTDEAIGLGFEKWIEAVKEMEEAFDPDWEDYEYDNINNFIKNNREKSELRAKGRKLFAEHFESLWW